MRNEFLPSSPPRVREKEIAEVMGNLRSDWITTDPKVERFKMVADVELRFAGARLAGASAGMRKDIPKPANITRTARDASRRAFDVVCAVTGLAVLAPLLVIVAAAIKLEDGGPVLFSQPRVGKGLTKFRLLKFRSMVPNDGGSSLLIAPDDPRITRVGRFLRKYKLDELPQLANVVKGEMQLVGVRPQVECFVEIFPAEYELLLQDRPGITDLATLAFRHEEQMFQAGPLEKQYISQMLPRKLRLSLQYRRTRTFFSDLGILFRTVLGFKSPAAN
jgi:lipopolysaccharide/colanic/teichoic acid biosynthesis glycosyltransferase